MIIKSLLKCFFRTNLVKLIRIKRSQTFGAERSFVFVFLRPVLLKLLIEDKSWERSGAPDEGPGGGGGGAGGGGPPKINKKQNKSTFKINKV